MNLLVINQPLCNRGDESAHKALLRSLCTALPNARIMVLFIDTYSESSIKQFDIHNERVKYKSYKTSDLHKYFFRNCWKWGLHVLWLFNLSSLRILCFYKKADWIISAPGGISMGGFQNWDHLYQLELARFMRKKVAYYGRSFGPFPTSTPSQRKYKKFSYRLLHYFDYLPIRYKETEKLADEIGLYYNSTVDCAFLESPCVELPYEVKKAIGDTPYMVFVPNLLIWHYAFKGKVSKEALLDYYSKMLDVMFEYNPNCNVVMLPQTFDYYTYEWDDVNLFRDIADMKNDSRIVVLPDCYSSDIQQSIIKKSILLVGGRYHSIVFSINQAIPFVALSYEHKIKGLLEALNKTTNMIDITKAFDNIENKENTLIEFEKIIQNVKPDVEAQKKAKKIAQDCFDKFIARLTGGYE